MSRCPMVCPHGDRCALGADEPHPQGGHNMRVCPCNEGLTRLLEVRVTDLERYVPGSDVEVTIAPAAKVQA